MQDGKVDIEIRDGQLRHPEIPKTGTTEKVDEGKKPDLTQKLTASDYKNLAKKFFFENLPDLLKLGISGNPIRLIIVGIILALLLYFSIF